MCLPRQNQSSPPLKKTVAFQNLNLDIYNMNGNHIGQESD